MKLSLKSPLPLIVLFALALGLIHVPVTFASTTSKPEFIYEIFTQSFSDSDHDGLGDLEGVRSKLDYLSDLGADAVWLTPIFESPSYHGYDVSDYQSIKSTYGTNTDFKNLVDDAHARGIKILLDLPVNHTSTKHPWFANSDLYLWSKTPLFLPTHWFAKFDSYFFSSFSKNLPDLNWKNPEVLTRIEAVFDYWTNLGVDGFRLDAAKFLIKGPHGEQNQPETHSLWKQITAHVKQTNPQTYFLGEVWDEPEVIASYYGSGDELDAAINFPMEGSIRSSLITGQTSDLYQALTEQVHTQKNAQFAAPFAGNHDLDRLASVLAHDIKLEKLAALLVFTLPGTPIVYYGDEIGMTSGNLSQYPGDLAKRTPMDWGLEDKDKNDSESLRTTYQTLARLRKNTPSLRTSEISEVLALGSAGLAYELTDSATHQSALVVINLSLAFSPAQVITIPNLNYRGPHVVYGSISAKWSTTTTLSIGELAPQSAAIIVLK
jgi:glycosidase